MNPASHRQRFFGPGDKLGKYDLIRQIAVGGMAELYLARTLGIEGFEKLVVLKRILPQYRDNERFVHMFLNEARLAATLHHPNIAQVYDIGQDETEYFFSMEYVHGEDLGRMIGTAGDAGVGVPLDAALTLVAGLCAGLNYAHAKAGPDGRPLNIVHRDVSPSNVLVSYDGAVKLVDFGIARAGSAPSTQGGLKGKVAYMSPEQCRGGASVDKRSDLYAVGTILYELTTGRLPFTDETEYGVLNQIVNLDAPTPSSIVPNYPPALEVIVMRALARDPEQRYRSAIELQGQIEDFAHENRLRISPLVLARVMSSLFPQRLEEWDHARAQGAFFVEQHVLRTLIESGKTPAASPPVGHVSFGEDTAVSAPLDTIVGVPPVDTDPTLTRAPLAMTPPRALPVTPQPARRGDARTPSGPVARPLPGVGPAPLPGMPPAQGVGARPAGLQARGIQRAPGLPGMQLPGMQPPPSGIAPGTRPSQPALQGLPGLARQPYPSQIKPGMPAGRVSPMPGIAGAQPAHGQADPRAAQTPPAPGMAPRQATPNPAVPTVRSSQQHLTPIPPGATYDVRQPTPIPQGGAVPAPDRAATPPGQPVVNHAQAGRMMTPVPGMPGAVPIIDPLRTHGGTLVSSSTPVPGTVVAPGPAGDVTDRVRAYASADPAINNETSIVTIGPRSKKTPIVLAIAGAIGIVVAIVIVMSGDKAPAKSTIANDDKSVREHGKSDSDETDPSERDTPSREPTIPSSETKGAADHNTTNGTTDNGTTGNGTTGHGTKGDPATDPSKTDPPGDPTGGTKPDVATKTDPQSDPKTDPKSDAKTGSKTDPTVGTKSDAKTGSKTDPTVGTKSDSKTDPTVGTKSDSNTDATVGTKSDSNTDATIGTKSDSNTDATIGTKTDSKTDPTVGTKVAPKSDLKTDPKPDPRPNSKTEPKPTNAKLATSKAQPKNASVAKKMTPLKATKVVAKKKPATLAKKPTTKPTTKPKEKEPGWNDDSPFLPVRPDKK